MFEIRNQVIHKARSVSKGYIQKTDINIFDTFSTTIRLETVRILLAN